MKLFQKPILLLLLAIGLFASYYSTAQPVLQPNTYEKDSLAAFHLIGTNGQKPDFKKAAKLSCFIFLAPDCPLSKNYAVLINQLKETYRTAVAFYLVVPGTLYSMKEIKQFSNAYLKKAVLYKDASLQLTKYLRATTTPEVVLLDADSGNQVYQGALDNWAVSLGRQRTKATENYLLDAVDKYLHNQPLTIAYKAPVGCLINDF